MFAFFRCRLLVCHPKFPLLFVGSEDGRMFVVAAKIDYVPQSMRQDHLGATRKEDSYDEGEFSISNYVVW